MLLIQFRLNSAGSLTHPLCPGSALCSLTLWACVSFRKLVSLFITDALDFMVSFGVDLCQALREPFQKPRLLATQMRENIFLLMSGCSLGNLASRRRKPNLLISAQLSPHLPRCHASCVFLGVRAC